MKKAMTAKFAAILSVLVCCCMMFSVTALAKESIAPSSYNISTVQAAATQYLQQVGGSESLQEPLNLYNLDDQLECVAYKVGTDGFLIINVKSYAVVEYSPTGGSPFHKIAAKHPGARLYYNGPLAYYYGSSAASRSNGSALITSWDNGKTYNKNAFTTRYTDTAKPFNAALGAANSTQYWFPTQRWSNGPQGASNHYMCVPVAVGIFLKYYQDTFTYGGKYRYLPTSMLNMSGNTLRNTFLKFLCKDNLYIYNGKDGMDSNTMLIGGVCGDKQTYSGLWGYLSEVADCPYVPQLTSWDWDSITARLQVKKPELMTLERGYPGVPDLQTFPHEAVVVGYTTSGSAQQLIINDGWGNNKHYIGVNDSYIRDWSFIQ